MPAKGALQTRFGVVEGAPAAFTETAYDALTFTDCAEVVSIGEFGREYNTVRIMNLATGATRKFKGSFDNGTIQADLLFDSADGGQTLLEAASLSRDPYSFRVQFPGGSGSEQFYFRALVTNLKRIVGGPDDALMLRATLEIDHNEIIEGTQ